MLATEPVFSVRGVRKLEFESEDWTTGRFIEWLKKGFARFADPAATEAWPFAFKPLVFRLDSSMMGQFASAIAEAQREGYDWPINLRRAIIEHLHGITLADEESLIDATNLWRSLTALGITGNDVNLARKLIKVLESEELPKEVKAVREFLTVLATSVAAAPLKSSYQERFFQFLRGRHDLWEDRLMIPFINTQLVGDDNEIAENWRSLRHNFNEELKRLSDPSTPTGRALVRTLARRLRAGWDNDGATIEAMRTLLDELEVDRIPLEENADFWVPASQDIPEEMLTLVRAEL